MTADYEFLTVDTVADYVRSVPDLARRINPDDLVPVREIGDGNLNLVFLLGDATGRGLVLKQALPYVRMTGEGWPMTPERARFGSTTRKSGLPARSPKRPSPEAAATHNADSESCSPLGSASSRSLVPSRLRPCRVSTFCTRSAVRFATSASSPSVGAESAWNTSAPLSVSRT